MFDVGRSLPSSSRLPAFAVSPTTRTALGPISGLTRFLSRLIALKTSIWMNEWNLLTPVLAVDLKPVVVLVVALKVSYQRPRIRNYCFHEP